MYLVIDHNSLSNWILVVYALFSLIFPANLHDFNENNTDLQELVIFLQICAKAKTFLQIYGNPANLQIDIYLLKIWCKWPKYFFEV